MSFSIFPSVKRASEPVNISIDVAYQRITSDRNKALCEQIRGLEDKKDRNALKLKLPAYTFSGVFSYRNETSLVKHSGLLCLDFDGLSPEELEDAKNTLAQDKYTHLLFISPSGNGLKLIIKIPDDPATHKYSCKAAFEYFNVAIKSNSDELEDVSRVCYDSYDPEAFFNPDAELFTAMRLPVETAGDKLPMPKFDSDSDKIFDKLQKWLNRNGYNFSQGSRNKYICKLAAALCRFGVPKDDAIRMMIYHFYSDDFPEDEILTVNNSAYKKYQGLYGTAFFEAGGQMQDRVSKMPLVEKEVLDMSVEPTDIIQMRDIKEQMLESYRHGLAKGTTTYFPLLDLHWRWKKGDINLIHGIPNHGKTTWWMQMTLIKSLMEGDRWAVFSPEQHPPIDFYDEFVQMYYGRPTSREFMNCVTEQEYSEAIDFLNEFYYFIYPEKNEPTPLYLIDKASELVAKKGVTGIVRDPYNQESHENIGQREDLYISKYLATMKRFVLAEDLYSIVVTHPKGLGAKVNKDGDISCPNVYDISGGAMWNNKTDNIVCVHRPFRISDPKDKLVHLDVQKIKKRKLIGEPGLVDMKFDFYESRYYIGDYNPLNDYWKKRGV